MRESYRKTLTWLAVLVSGAPGLRLGFPARLPDSSRRLADLAGRGREDRSRGAAPAGRPPGRTLRGGPDGRRRRARGSARSRRRATARRRWCATPGSKSGSSSGRSRSTPPDAQPRDWSYQAEIAFDGTVLVAAQGLQGDRRRRRDERRRRRSPGRSALLVERGVRSREVRAAGGAEQGPRQPDRPRRAVRRPRIGTEQPAALRHGRHFRRRRARRRRLASSRTSTRRR